MESLYRVYTLNVSHLKVKPDATDLLNALNPDDPGEQLLGAIFLRKPRAGEVKNAKRRSKMLRCMRELMERHRAIDFGKLLRVAVNRAVRQFATHLMAARSHARRT